MDDWDAEPGMAAANNQEDYWGADDAGAVPLPADIDDFAFRAPTPVKETNTVVRVTEVPAAAAEDDWDMGGGFSEQQLDPFGSAAAGPDGSGSPTQAELDQFVMANASFPPVAKPKRVIRPDLIPEKSKAFADFFIAQLSEQYEAQEPDMREMPLRRNETHNIYSKELAISAAAEVEKPQPDAEKKNKENSAIHYNGNRVTTNHTWTDFEVRLLLGLINRNIHQAGKSEDQERLTKRTIIARRKRLNASLPEAADGHSHRGQWAYHDVADLMNNEVDRCKIPVVDVRDMLHRLVDDRKAGQRIALRIRAPRLNRRVVMAWKRKQDFTGDLKEWLGDKENKGRKFVLERQAKAAKNAQLNPGNVVQASAAAGVSGVSAGWVGRGAFAEEVDVQAPSTAGVSGVAAGWVGDALAEEAVVAVNDDAFGDFSGQAPVAPAGGGGERGEEENVAEITGAPAVGDDAEWGAEKDAIAGLVAAHNQATPAPAKDSEHVSEPLGEFGLADPFSAPLPGNTGFTSAATIADNGLDAWDKDDDSGPLVPQSGNADTVMVDASCNTSNAVEQATGSNIGDSLVGEENDVAPAVSSRLSTSGSAIARGKAETFLDTIIANTNITSPTATGYQSSGFTAVNAPLHAQAPQQVAPPAQSYTVDSPNGFNPEHLALLASPNSDREDTPSEQERDPQGSWGQQHHVPRKVEAGVSSFNAIPLAYNRLTGQRVDLAPTSDPTRAKNGNWTLARPMGGGGASTPMPGWDNSPKELSDAAVGDWDAPFAKAFAAQPADKDKEGDAANGGEENKPKERKYVDLDAEWDAAGADDVELDY